MRDISWIIVEIIVFGFCGYLLSSFLRWLFSSSYELSFFLGYSITYILFLFVIADNLKRKL